MVCDEHDMLSVADSVGSQEPKGACMHASYTMFLHGADSCPSNADDTNMRLLSNTCALPILASTFAPDTVMNLGALG